MRFATKMMTAAAALVLATASVAPATPFRSASVVPMVTAVSITPAAHVVAAVQSPTPPPKVDVTISTNNSRGAWYTQPMWIAIGVIGLIVIILLAVVAGRRDTTTIVK